MHPRQPCALLAVTLGVCLAAHAPAAMAETSSWAGRVDGPAESSAQG